MLTTLIVWAVLGLIAGALAKFVMPGSDPGGLVATIILGILGAIVGGYIGTLLGFGEVTGLNAGSILLAAIGAILLLVLYRAVRR